MGLDGIPPVLACGKRGGSIWILLIHGGKEDLIVLHLLLHEPELALCCLVHLLAKIFYGLHKSGKAFHHDVGKLLVLLHKRKVACT